MQFFFTISKTLASRQVMRIIKVINYSKGYCLGIRLNSEETLLRNVWKSLRRIHIHILGVKGINSYRAPIFYSTEHLFEGFAKNEQHCFSFLS